MQNEKTKKIIILLLKIVAIVVCLFFIAENYFFEISPFAESPTFILSFLVLIILKWRKGSFLKKTDFKLSHLLPTIFVLFFAIHFRAGIVWALNTFPLRDANTVWLTLQEPFDDFAYSMIKLYLSTTLLQAFVITIILTLFLYTLFSKARNRIFFIGMYFLATILLFISRIPVSDYMHILNNEPEKNASPSEFFIKNYVNPDSVIITAPEQKRNLILIYLESLETTFSDKEHGGNQEENLISEITELAQQNINFGKNKNFIGGGVDAVGSAQTFAAMHTRSLGIPNVINYRKAPILRHYKSLYKILNEYGYKQIFFQGNSGFYNGFKELVTDHKVNESYGPEDLIQRFDLDTANFTKSQLFKSIPDKDVFKIAGQILDTLSEPFSLTFFTIDTHAPSGFYDPHCVKSIDEKNENENLKASARCVSRELKKFLDTLKTKTLYKNTSIVVFGDHLFMGSRLVKGFTNRKWVNIFINSSKKPITEEKRLFSDIDMLPTILSSINFNIEGDKLGFGTDLFSEKKTLIEQIGLDSLNREINNMESHLIYESLLIQKRLK